MDRPIWLVGMNLDDSKREDEFNEWYNKVHVPDVLNIPGVVNANRYVIEGSAQGMPRYIAIYELEDEEAMRSSPEMRSVIMDFGKEWASSTSGLCSVMYKHIGP